MESRDSTSTTYRWFATSDDNEPVTGVNTFLDSGTIVFDRSGNIISPADGRFSIAIDHPAQSPLVFDLDFSQVSGLAQTDSSGAPVSFVNMSRQDGFPPGTLTSFTITESGLIRGVFSNGAERPLGQIRMARFANTTGLQQAGNNLYSQGINSGEPPATVRRAVDSWNLTFPVVLDSDGSIRASYRILGQPHSLLLSREGDVMWEKRGPLIPEDLEGIQRLGERTLDG